MDWALLTNYIETYWHMTWTIIDIGLVIFILWKLREVSHDFKKGQRK